VVRALVGPRPVLSASRPTIASDIAAFRAPPSGRGSDESSCAATAAHVLVSLGTNGLAGRRKEAGTRRGESAAGDLHHNLETTAPSVSQVSNRPAPLEAASPLPTPRAAASARAPWRRRSARTGWAPARGRDPTSPPGEDFGQPVLCGARSRTQGPIPGGPAQPRVPRSGWRGSARRRRAAERRPPTPDSFARRQPAAATTEAEGAARSARRVRDADCRVACGRQ
jgi:hypothetical protein